MFGIIGVGYGTYLLIWHFNHGNGLNVALLVLGLCALGLLAYLYTVSYFQNIYFTQVK